MIVARLFSKIYKKGGIVLVDHLGQKNGKNGEEKWMCSNRNTSTASCRVEHTLIK